MKIKIILLLYVIIRLQNLNGQLLLNLHEEFKVRYNPALTSNESGTIGIYTGNSTFVNNDFKEIENGLCFFSTLKNPKTKLIASINQIKNYNQFNSYLSGQLAISRTLKIARKSFMNYSFGVGYFNFNQSLPNVTFGDQINSNGIIHGSSKEDNFGLSFNNFSFLSGISFFRDNMELGLSVINLSNVKFNNSYYDGSLIGSFQNAAMTAYIKRRVSDFQNNNTNVNLLSLFYFNRDLLESKIGFDYKFSNFLIAAHLDYIQYKFLKRVGMNLNILCIIDNFNLSYGYNTLFLNGNHEIALSYRFNQKQKSKVRYKPSFKNLENEII